MGGCGVVLLDLELQMEGVGESMCQISEGR